MQVFLLKITAKTSVIIYRLYNDDYENKNCQIEVV